MAEQVIPEQVIQFHRQRPESGRLARLGLWLRRHRKPIIAAQWLVVLVYASLVIVPAFMPLPSAIITVTKEKFTD